MEWVLHSPTNFLPIQFPENSMRKWKRSQNGKTKKRRRERES